MPQRLSSYHLLLLFPIFMACLVLGELLPTFAARLPYPFDLEWMEGGVLAHAWRIQHGKEIYVDPSAEFIPMIYPPGYPSLLATLGTVFPLGAPLGRAVSLLGIFSAIAAMTWGAHRRFNASVLGLLSGIVFLATYEKVGAFFDLVRPDGLFVGLAAWTVVLGLERSKRAHTWAAILLFLAFTSKQNIAIIGVPISIGIMTRDGWKEALRFGLLAAIPALMWLAYMEIKTDGFFLTYLLEVAASHPVKWNRVIPGAFYEVGTAIPVVLSTLSVFALISLPKVLPKVGPFRLMLIGLLGISGGFISFLWCSSMKIPQGLIIDINYGPAGSSFVGVLLVGGLLTLATGLFTKSMNTGWFYGGSLLVAVLFMVGLMRGHHGGFINVYIFFYWVACFGFAAALSFVVKYTPRPWVGVAIASGLVSLQLWIQYESFNLDRLKPQPADYEAGEMIVEALETVDGPVMSPYAPWLPALAGHEPGWHLISYWDVRHPTGPLAQEATRINRAVRQQKYGAIVSSNESMKLGIDQTYDVKNRFRFPSRTALLPKTGWRKRPTTLWTPKDRSIRPARPTRPPAKPPEDPK